jgi:hypothetical protein
MKWCKPAFRVSFHKADEHEGETAAIAAHARAKIRTALNTYWHASASAMQPRNTIFTMTMPSVIIPSRASESSREANYRPCGVTITSTASALIRWVTRTVSG